MPRNVTNSRLVYEVDLDIDKMPDGSGGNDGYIWKVTVPKRGIVHRATLLLGSSSFWPTGSSAVKASGIFVLTSATDGATGTALLSEAQAKTCIAQAACNQGQLQYAGGGTIVGASNLRIGTIPLDFNVHPITVNSASAAWSQGGSGPMGFFYDVSNALGPVSGTGDLYFFFNAVGEDFNTDLVFAKFRLEVEPVQ